LHSFVFQLSRWVKGFGWVEEGMEKRGENICTQEKEKDKIRGRG
jgi:hypothetical protein